MIETGEEHPEFTGLRNHGATCYMNSLLQCLFHIGRFREIVYRLGEEEARKSAEKDDSTAGGSSSSTSCPNNEVGGSGTGKAKSPSSDGKQRTIKNTAMASVRGMSVDTDLANETFRENEARMKDPKMISAGVSGSLLPSPLSPNLLTATPTEAEMRNATTMELNVVDTETGSRILQDGDALMANSGSEDDPVATHTDSGSPNLVEQLSPGAVSGPGELNLFTQFTDAMLDNPDAANGAFGRSAASSEGGAGGTAQNGEGDGPTIGQALQELFFKMQTSASTSTSSSSSACAPNNLMRGGVPNALSTTMLMKSFGWGEENQLQQHDVQNFLPVLLSIR